MALCARLLSLAVVSSGLIHVVKVSAFLSFLWLNNSPCVYLPHFFYPSSFDGQLCGLHPLASVNMLQGTRVCVYLF